MTDNFSSNIFFQPLKEHIKKLAAEFIQKQYGPEITCTLSVNIMHPGMKEYHGYFLSRED